MPNTANDLARAVGIKIGIIDAVSELSADELNDLKNYSRSKHAELRVSHVCFWDEDDIPDEVYEPLKSYFAACFGEDFGKTIRDEPLSVAQTQEARLAKLIRASVPRYTGSVATTEYI